MGYQVKDKAKRYAIYNRDNWQCRYCRVKVVDDVEGDTMATIDHAIPIARGGTNDSSNLLTACFSCNTLKGYLTAEEFRESGLLQMLIDARVSPFPIAAMKAVRRKAGELSASYTGRCL